MKIQLLCSAVVLGWCVTSVVSPPATSQPASPAVSTNGGTVSVDLYSMHDGGTYGPGDPVEWKMRVNVSSGDNLGLALICCDLEQDPSNPVLFDLPRGRAFTIPMRAFDHPDGLTNPGLTTAKSGYGGTPDGPSGRQNLIQIGGAQNTFGMQPPCLGPNQDLCRGLDFDVDTGIGQGVNGQPFASGNFRLPETPGTYTFRVTNVRANTLTQINVPPLASAVDRADIAPGNDTITFTVQ